MKLYINKTLIIICLLFLSGCNNSEEVVFNTKIERNENMKEISLYIDGTKIVVDWEDNDSTKAIYMNLEKEDILVEMSKYGNFEQVGDLGFDLPTEDKQLTTKPGDIMLYLGNKIVIFFNSNSWSYTKLGKINLNEIDLNNILNKDNVKLVLSLE